ncbi:hypothetical protein [Effusibacillus pohliae]|uniref:hypothetical protein n=1 Tax=Effusibacillus pohliae TaxID=232270 RepID=UPI00036F0A69|nr:hypothetical protein [Effusibacillus pohliae]
MRPAVRREQRKGIKFFHFDLADPSHESLLKRARKLDPMVAIGKITQIDEY